MVKCTIVNIDRCSLNDGPGIRTVIFFKGCNLRCMWCHNPETYAFQPEEYENNGKKNTYGYTTTDKELEKIILRDKDYYINSNGGVTLSGGEALLQIESVIEIAKFCKQNNIHICVETSGAVPLENIKKIEDYIDCWLYDYKLTDESKYLEYLRAKPSLIISNLNYLIERKKDIILRCPLIHTINDNNEHFEAISKLSYFVNRVEILPYHNLGKSKADNLKIEHYFSQENTPAEIKKQWNETLKKFSCKNYKIL